MLTQVGGGKCMRWECGGAGGRGGVRVALITKEICLAGSLDEVFPPCGSGMNL